eukprot:Plantae.Rhodophyta-Purpureofilum_apyrenoidigerum.ctg14918.p1 GENE.Plantae.Rhodophyta-Purpureofilum_apyrenoidigerum.ctg14918~~Plantae.Rhodophyta-Purpureofilum_apyrenoidigerum.ctg14918.p1  ORF type:complete len:635 (+),score=133.71 Plantae.Rhodophyta-Purpureofilum_apyrenoidigerum.ctg14918:1082-2986(+)
MSKGTLTSLPLRKKASRSFLEHVLGVVESRSAVATANTRTRPDEGSLTKEARKDVSLDRGILPSILRELNEQEKDKLEPMQYRKKFAVEEKEGKLLSRALQKLEIVNEVEKGWSLLPSLPLRARPAVEAPANDPPRLEHGLESVLAYTGAVPLFDEKKGKFNFTESLKSISQPHEIREDAMPEFVRASKHEGLRRVAERLGNVRYRSSTSSVTKTLSLIYQAISNYRAASLDGMTLNFNQRRNGFARHVYIPTVLSLHPEDKASRSRAFDCGDYGVQGETILSKLGESLERFLTMSSTAFEEKLLKSASDEAKPRERLKDTGQAYNYTTVGDILIRSQLDCHRKVDNKSDFFEIKSRAVAPIRYQLSKYEAFLDYKIDRGVGTMNSYELEFYDMIRTAFLRYSLQVRLGRMSGAFICYHNTKEIFGFEYIRREEMERYAFGSEMWADIAFDTTMKLLKEILDTATKTFTNQEDALKITIALSNIPGLDVYIQRVGNDEDPTSPVKMVEYGDQKVDDLVSPSGPLKIKEGDLQHFHLQVQPYVNGTSVEDQVKLKPTDVYQLTYKFDHLPQPDLHAYIKALRFCYQIDEFTLGCLPKGAKKHFVGNAFGPSVPKSTFVKLSELLQEDGKNIIATE